MKRPVTNISVTLCGLALLAIGACSKPQAENESTTESVVEQSAPIAAETAAVVYASLKGDVAAGEKAYIQCKVCHAMEEGKTGIGPSLHKVIGRAAAAVPGFVYSSGMKSSGITWTEDKLYDYIEKPQAVVPGTKMSFVGYPEPQKRADVIAWMKANGGS